MFPITLFLSHFVSDFAFSNVYSKKFLDRTNYYKHLIWLILVFLAFNFDMLKGWGLLIVPLSIILHIGFDLFRINSKQTKFLHELLFLAIFLFLSYIFKPFFQNSYLTTIFQLYIVGMVTTTSFGSYLFRTFNILGKEEKDTIGGSERLAIYIFALSQNYLWVLIAVAAGIAYKFLFVKKRNYKEMIFSPIYGVVVSYLWYLLMIILF